MTEAELLLCAVLLVMFYGKSFLVLYILYSRVQWFWLFFTFWGITTHPWHPKGPRIWKLAKKIFQLHAWPAEIFGKNRKMRFFGMISKFNVRSPVWQIFTIFSACFIYGILNTHLKIFFFFFFFSVNFSLSLSYHFVIIHKMNRIWSWFIPIRCCIEFINSNCRATLYTRVKLVFSFGPHRNEIK